MTTTPLISIILPVYNGERYLKDSIQSCLDQTYLNWELIIADDGSTDQTPAIISDFAAKERRIRSIRHAANRRLPAALNTGFALAQGAYLTWTSADNAFLPQALAEMAASLGNQPDADLVYTDYDIITETGQFVQRAIAAEPWELLQWHNGMPCFLYRRRVYEQVGPYAEDLFLAEDYDYWLRVLAGGFQMCPLHKNLYRYRTHAHSLTSQHKQKAFQAAERALHRNLPHMTGLQRSTRGRSYLFLAALAKWQRNYLGVVHYALLALRYAPFVTLGKLTASLGKSLQQRALL